MFSIKYYQLKISEKIKNFWDNIFCKSNKHIKAPSTTPSYYFFLENKENAHIVARGHALEIEKLRAKQIANLPTSDDFRTDQELNKLIEKKACKIVTMHEANIFANTRYHMPDTYVEKEIRAGEEMIEHNQNACQDAATEQQKQKELKNEIERTKQERLEKARLRGKHAIDKQLLNEVKTLIYLFHFAKNLKLLILYVPQNI